ncbi:lipid A export permease/ATP-binding protein MsbA [uncultured Piscinibacter sp.]|uniref:lipid A export permease/ATP-binding protein MsbA n=1 Tax=uncultured Piscinibacter sp. TaxID=1131835 RepID=UPI0026277A84|nr:lipid A export permease/ATP-binding protein MsbA [uncultured Piscinibacter sp.]
MPDAPESLTRRIKRIAPYFANSRRGLALAALGAVVGALTEPMIPSFMKHLLDAGFQQRSLPLWQIPVIVIGLFALRGFAGFVAQYGLSWAANRGMVDLRAALFSRLMNAEPALYARNTASSLINTVTYEVQNGALQLTHALTGLVRDSLTLVALLGYLLWLNWKLTLFVGVLFPAVAWIMRTLSRRLHRLTVAGQKATDELAYVVEENVLAWRIVRLHSAQAAEGARFARASEALRRLSVKAAVAAATMTPLTQLLAACALSAVIVVALWQSGRSGGSVGGFVAFVMAMLQLVAPIKHLSEVAGPITRGLAAVERGVRLVETTPVEVGGSHDPGRCEGRIELREVTLQYPGAAAPALADVSLMLNPGETVALVGPSGAGKSTIVNLLPRFLEPTSGTLLLDGVPLRDWSMHALRRQFALVSQDVVLFNDSIAANVALSDAVDPARVTEALRGANLLDFVQSLPQGLDAPVGHNGSQLSGGQRQRLAIARAIYKDAPILVLDEATSALDSESERLVQDALERLMKGRTSIVIAHRLSTIERADRIVALEAGRVVEQGSHAELLAAGGLYARLHALQFRSPA